jgi:hypothetical protein
MWQEVLFMSQTNCNRSAIIYNELVRAAGISNRRAYRRGERTSVHYTGPWSILACGHPHTRAAAALAAAHRILAGEERPTVVVPAHLRYVWQDLVGNAAHLAAPGASIGAGTLIIVEDAQNTLRIQGAADRLSGAGSVILLGGRTQLSALYRLAQPLLPTVALERTTAATTAVLVVAA